MSCAVSRRTLEIGVRIALGADPQRVHAYIVGEGVTPAVVTAGLGVALTLTRLMRGLLYGVSATDVSTFAVVTAILGVAVLASWIPARRATQINPVRALRGN